MYLIFLCTPPCVCVQDWHQKQVDTARRRSEQAARARQKMAGRGLAQVGGCLMHQSKQTASNIVSFNLKHFCRQKMAGRGLAQVPACCCSVLCCAALCCAVLCCAAVLQAFVSVVGSCAYLLLAGQHTRDSPGQSTQGTIHSHTLLLPTESALQEHLDDDQVLDWLAQAEVAVTMGGAEGAAAAAAAGPGKEMPAWFRGAGGWQGGQSVWGLGRAGAPRCCACFRAACLERVLPG